MKNLLKNKHAKLLVTALILVMLIYLIFPNEQNKTAQPVKLPPNPKPAPINLPTPPSLKTKNTDTTNAKEEEDVKFLPSDFPAGKTVDEAWKTLVELWNENPTSSDFDIYTDTGKLIQKDFIGKNYLDIDPKTYKEGEYTILTKGNFAVVNFELPKNNEKIPFLFYKTASGWKFDVVHQKKLVRPGQLSTYGVEKYLSPYTHIIRNFRSYSGIDIPLEKEDVYKIADDTKLAEEIKNLETLYYSGQMTFEKAVELARLYSSTSMYSKCITLLKKIRKSLPKNPDVYKYIAISDIISKYDYRSAKNNIKIYLELKPDSEFGHNFLAFTFQKRENFEEAEKEYQKALEINPDSCYANSKLPLVYKELGEVQKSAEFFKKAETSCKQSDYERYIWLIQWKHNKN